MPSAMQEMDGGDSMFTFVKSGPFFFISGNAQNCQRGQKLTVIVLAVRHNKLTHSLSPAPTPSPAEATDNGPSESSDISPSGSTSLAPSSIGVRLLLALGWACSSTSWAILLVNGPQFVWGFNLC
ncbi:Early nodulin-like protein [Vigna angularis]|uniref:Early nodulin-like protein n=1 Tax=Phaseolus angularis TaxID=3914 RepID=A0A8T0JHK4_PHAAN|nr:Early nodulin-like protein [Vigna angularis]